MNKFRELEVKKQAENCFEVLEFLHDKIEVPLNECEYTNNLRRLLVFFVYLVDVYSSIEYHTIEDLEQENTVLCGFRTAIKCLYDELKQDK